MKNKDDKEKPDVVELSVPWGSLPNNEVELDVEVGPGRRNSHVNTIRIANKIPSYVGKKQIKTFIEERTRLHETYIQEKEKSKRLALILSAVFFLCASAITVFAPEGRETISYWIGGTLFIFSAGAAGYKRLWVKGPKFNFEADDNSYKSIKRRQTESSNSKN